MYWLVSGLTFYRCSLYKTQLVMSLLPMSFRDRFCMSRKSGTGEGWWVHLKGANSVAVSGLSFTNTLVGTGWAVSLLVCTSWLRK